jgi:hypothetical protein
MADLTGTFVVSILAAIIAYCMIEVIRRGGGTPQQ